MGDELGTPFRKESLMRKVIALLVIALSCSTALNVYLLAKAGVLRREREMYGELLMGRGCYQGKADAERDFKAGTPKWYQIGDFAVPVPSDKPGRAHATVGCLVSPYEEAYVKKYNQTMDVLCNTKVTRRTDSQASEEAAAEAGNE